MTIVDFGCPVQMARFPSLLRRGQGWLAEEAAESRLSLSFRDLRCHPEPFACHSERNEESRSAPQGKLREEPVLNEVKESRSGVLRVNSARNRALVCYQGSAGFLVACGASE